MRINNGVQTSYNSAESINSTSNKTRVDGNTKIKSEAENKVESTINEDKVDKNVIQNESKTNNNQLEKAVVSMNDFIKTTDTSLQFNLHEELDRYYVKIVDSETEEVIKEIPPEKMLDLYAEILQSIGILVDKKI